MAAANVDHAARAGRHRGHGRPRRSGVKVDPGRHRRQDTRYDAYFHARAQKEKKENSQFRFSSDSYIHKIFFFFIERRNSIGGRRLDGGVPCRRWRMEIESGDRLALGIPSLVG